MNEKKLVALEQLRQFLARTTEVEFQACGQDEERYRHIEGILKRFGYRKLGRADKGLVLRYLERGSLLPVRLTQVMAATGRLPPMWTELS